MPSLSGTVTDLDGGPLRRTVRVHDRLTGAMVAETISGTDGAWTATVPSLVPGAYYAVCFDAVIVDDGGGGGCPVEEDPVDYDPNLADTPLLWRGYTPLWDADTVNVTQPDWPAVGITAYGENVGPATFYPRVKPGGPFPAPYNSAMYLEPQYEGQGVGEIVVDQPGAELVIHPTGWTLEFHSKDAGPEPVVDYGDPGGSDLAEISVTPPGGFDTDLLPPQGGTLTVYTVIARNEGSELQPQWELRVGQDFYRVNPTAEFPAKFQRGNRKLQFAAWVVDLPIFTVAMGDLTTLEPYGAGTREKVTPRPFAHRALCFDQSKVIFNGAVVGILPGTPRTDWGTLRIGNLGLSDHGALQPIAEILMPSEETATWTAVAFADFRITNLARYPAGQYVAPTKPLPTNSAPPPAYTGQLNALVFDRLTAA